MKTSDIDAHAHSMKVRGYTIIPNQVSAEQVKTLNAAADRALDTVSRAVTTGVKPSHTQFNAYVRSVRCFYTWDSSCRQLLEHDTAHALGTSVLGKAKLWDMSVLEALPMPRDAELGPFNWHRDFAPGREDSYLWLFTCLTDVTEENGATWVIPGSHRNPVPVPSKQVSASSPRPVDAVQLTARAGDMVAINPAMIHCVGENRTHAGRRLALVGLCRNDRSPLLNHWSIAGPAMQSTANRRERALLYTTDPSVKESWEVLPEGWQLAKTSEAVRAMRGLYRRTEAAFSKPAKLWRRVRSEP